MAGRQQPVAVGLHTMNPSEHLAAEYSAKAAAYARHWSPVIRPMAQPLLEALPLSGARHVLDVGAGTGALIPDLQRLAPGATLIAIDRAEGMLRVQASRPRCSRAVMDAAQLALLSESADVALLAFVLFHTPDPRAVLRAVHDALRRGGSIGLVTWGDDPGTPGLTAWTEELNRAGAAPDPRDRSVMQQALMDTPAKVTALLTDAGFAAPRAWTRRFRHQFTLDELLAVQTGCGGPARRLATLPPETAAHCEARVRERLTALPELVYEPEVVYGVAVVGGR